MKKEIRQKREEICAIFQEKNPVKLHTKILNSQILNRFAEARVFPLSSFKYHLLLTSEFFFNLENGSKWHDLYLVENAQSISQFQIIYKDSDCEWTLSPVGGLSRVSPKFY